MASEFWLGPVNWKLFDQACIYLQVTELGSGRIPWLDLIHHKLVSLAQIVFESVPASIYTVFIQIYRYAMDLKAQNLSIEAQLQSKQKYDYSIYDKVPLFNL